MYLIKNKGVETYPIPSKPGSKIFNTIIYDKMKNKFYRIEWGEIADEDGVNHLWYSDIVEEVKLNESRWQEGWLTKKEIKEIDVKESEKIGIVNMSDYLLHNVENNLINVNEANKLDFDNLQIIGGEIGKGKTLYSTGKALEALINNESVLLFSTEISKEETKARMQSILSNTRMLSKLTTDKFNNEESKMSFIDGFLNKAKLTIDDNYLINDNYVVNKMRQQAKEKDGLDLVIIDNLHLVVGNSKLNNNEEFDRIQHLLEDVCDELKCRVLVTIQLNRSL